MTTVRIAGAGLAGLSAAVALGRRLSGIHEAKPVAGGLVASRRRDGFVFDHTGHLFHLTGASWDFVARRVPDLVFHERRAVVYWAPEGRPDEGIWMPFPFQGNLAFLPSEVREECEAGLAAVAGRPPDRTNFARWCATTFGEGVLRHFLRPYNEKLYGRRLEELSADYIRYIPRPVSGKPVGYNHRFAYPREGGAGRLVEALAREVGAIALCDPVLSVAFGRRGGELRTPRGAFPFDRLLSSLPLPELVRRTEDAPEELRRLAGTLRATEVLGTNLGVRGRGPSWHWAYFASPEIPFYRVGHYTGFSPASAPRGFFALYIERARPDGKPAPPGDVVAWLERLGIVPDARAVVLRDEFAIPAAYTLPLPGRGEAVRRITAWYRARGAEPIGRYGRWTYNAMGEAIADGRTAARRIVRA